MAARRLKARLPRLSTLGLHPYNLFFLMWFASNRSEDGAIRAVAQHLRHEGAIATEDGVKPCGGFGTLQTTRLGSELRPAPAPTQQGMLVAQSAWVCMPGQLCERAAHVPRATARSR